MPKSAICTPGVPRPVRQQPDHLDAERVVALEDVAHAGNQRVRPLIPRPPAWHGSTSSGAKYRNRPCAVWRSAAGSSASVTAR